MDFDKAPIDKPASSGAEPQVSPFAKSAQEQYKEHRAKLGALLDAPAPAPASDGSNTLLAAGVTAGLVLAGAAVYGLSRGKAASPFKFLTNAPSTEIRTSFSLGMVSEHGKPLAQAVDGLLDGASPLFRQDFDAITKFGSRRLYPALSFKPVEQIQPSKYAVRLTDQEVKGGLLGEVRKKETFTWDHPFEDFKTPLPWRPSQASVEARGQSQKFVQELSDKNYEGALRTAIDIPVMRSVALNPPGAAFDIPMRAADLRKTDIGLELARMGKVGSFNGDHWQVLGVPETKLKVLLPRPTVELDSGTKVHFLQFESAPHGGHSVSFPTKSVDNVPLNPTDLNEIQLLRQSPQGQRVVEETAIIAFEENVVHANQFARSSYDLLSPSYAKFAAEWADVTKSKPHFDAFRGALMHGDKGRFMVKEQEVPFMAYDAGMPLETVLDHFYFGSRHVDQRTAGIHWLLKREGQEALVPGMSKGK